MGGRSPTAISECRNGTARLLSSRVLSGGGSAGASPSRIQFVASKRIHPHSKSVARSHLNDAQSLLFEPLGDKLNRARRHVAGVFKTVSARFRLQIALERHAQRPELHPQPFGRFVPTQIRRIAAEKLIPRPVER